MASTDQSSLTLDPAQFSISQENPGLIDEIKALQANRQKHAEAIAAIDLVLARIGQTLTAIRSAGETAPGAQKEGASAAMQGVRGSMRGRKYRKLPLTGDEFVLDLVRRREGMTTYEINAAWRAQGRGGVANNVIGRLLKQGLIVREPLEDQRGSRYRAAAHAPTI